MPAGKKRILHPAYIDAMAFRLAVSSVTPSPATGKPATFLMLMKSVKG